MMSREILTYQYKSYCLPLISVFDNGCSGALVETFLR